VSDGFWICVGQIWGGFGCFRGPCSAPWRPRARSSAQNRAACSRGRHSSSPPAGHVTPEGGQEKDPPPPSRDTPKGTSPMGTPPKQTPTETLPIGTPQWGPP
uniref:Uncharacterized protein n=1 Tax=Strigops habroptila TaxID=2489341 RepID=A0A672U3P4_STRHB